jgi:peptidoglycan hydrolase-like protein with peptidoglycan-binding domain
MSVTIPRLTVEPQIKAAADNQPTLKIGATGNGVSILQQALIDLGHPMPLSTHGGESLPDGIFGAETDRVVKTFQRNNGLVADGAAGRLTFKQLEDALIADDVLRKNQLRAEMQISQPIG